MERFISVQNDLKILVRLKIGIKDLRRDQHGKIYLSSEMKTTLNAYLINR